MVAVKSRSKVLKDTTIDLEGKEVTISKILKEISQNNRYTNPNRLRLTYLKEDKQIAILDDTFFQSEDFSKNESLQLFVKDLGMQISWRLVFLIEYIGPIIVHSFLYYLSNCDSFRSKTFNSNVHYNSILNKVAFALIIFHYLKRELETLFIHKFSLATMPIFNVFKNSAHYWLLNGSIALGYFGYGFLLDDNMLFQMYSSLGLSDINTLISLMVLSEALNFYTHIRLRCWGDLQKLKGNTTKRVAINDGIFKALIAPNYTFEMWSWFWFTVIFKFNIFAVIFFAVSTIQMYLWAQKKNRKYGVKRAFFIPYLF